MRSSKLQRQLTRKQKAIDRRASYDAANPDWRKPGRLGSGRIGHSSFGKGALK